MRRCILLIMVVWALLAVASDHLDRVARFVDSMDETAMMRWCDTSPVQGLEGVWYYPAENVTMGIRRCEYSHPHNDCYVIIMLANDNDLELLPGTVMGHIEQSAVSNRFKLTLFSERDHVTLLRPVEMVAALNDKSDELTFDPPHWNVKVRVNLVRFLPTIFGKLAGVSVIPEIKGERLPIGFKKVYPNVQRRERVRYL